LLLFPGMAPNGYLFSAVLLLRWAGFPGEGLVERGGDAPGSQRLPPGSKPATSDTREMMIAARSAVQKNESMVRCTGV